MTDRFPRPASSGESRPTSRSGYFRRLLPTQLRSERQPFTDYERLMSYRVRDILLVASLYDSYILAEDGQLTELILDRYVDLNLRYAPRVHRVASGEEALQALRSRDFDVVLTMSHMPDMAVQDFALQAKACEPDIPVFQLLYHLDARTKELSRSGGVPGIDRMIHWTGDATILLAVIKLIEDSINAPRDCDFGVQVIILVEDSIRFTSSYLPIITTELVKQTQSLMAEGLNTSHRLLRQAARPKILLAQDFEEARELYRAYKANVMGIISDMSFPVDGVANERAGEQFIAMVREDVPDLPVLLQSSDPEAEATARRLDASFLNKRSPTLLADLRAFMTENLGFGDFVFRTPDGVEQARASDLRALERALREAPAESVAYHARRNHFSRWLRARTEFELARRIRGRQLDDYDDVDALREDLVRALKGFRIDSQRDVVAEFSRARYDLGSVFVKIGGGSLGGKGRGLAFANFMLSRFNVRDHFDEMQIAIPNTAVLGTDIFDDFLESNRLGSVLQEEDSEDASVVDRFLAAKLPPSIYDDLRAFLDIARYPLAVRSSSLLEDSHTLPFAGVYDTYMLPNTHPDPAIRLDQLCDAIKLVYASTFFQRSRRYRNSTALRTEEEKMAVIVQQLVGATHGEVFYPEMSGVARSHNDYPYGKARPEDGVTYLAMGLGKTVVEGGRSLRFCPRYPTQIPHFSTTEGILEHAQRSFFALDVSKPERYPKLGDDGLIKLELEDALGHGTLKYIGSSYSPENDRISDGVGRRGSPLVTFSQVLKHKAFPVARAIETLLEMGRQSMSVPVEIEFAINLSVDPEARGETSAQLGFLQIRPLVRGNAESDQSWDFEREDLLCESHMVMGNGQFEGLRDIIYIHPDRFERSQTRAMAAAIARMNAGLRREGREAILIGPGRWGSSDEWLGIPIDWTEISGARLIVEVNLERFQVEPSQGAHFFQNLTAFNVGYMTVSEQDERALIRWDWLEALAAHDATAHVRHVRVPDSEALTALLDGRKQRGIILPERAARIRPEG